MPTPPPEKILDLATLLRDLVADGLLTQDSANEIAGRPGTRPNVRQHPLTEIAAQQPKSAHAPATVLSLDALSAWLAARAGLPLVHIDPLRIKVAAVTAVMSFEFARRHSILCVEVKPDSIVIACAQPYVTAWIAGLEQAARKTVRRVVANPADIEKYLVEFYTLSRSVFGAGRSSGDQRAAITNFEQLLDLGALKNPEAGDQHIVSIVDWLLQYAFDQRASDIHIEPRRDKGKIRFRIDGILHQVYDLPAAVLAAVVSRLKILARMNVAERRRPQDGRIKTKTPAGQEVELRLSTLPTAFGEKMVLRIFDPDVLLRDFAALGLAGDDGARWRRMIDRSHGIVLVTGPTGSGKTTTMYSTLKLLATEDVNVSTVEDPIEMVEDSFNQSQVQPQIDFDFAAGIRTLMRQDPDIIMVGEIRDLATADMAIQAALTGHLVLSTLHTNDAPTAISRLLDLGVPAHMLKVTLNGVMAQRLLRTLCPHCREPAPMDAEAWARLVRPAAVAMPAQMYRPVGCLECRNTGYLGRQGIYEIMTVTETLRPLINDHCDVAALRAQALREGMRTLRLSGAQAVAAGATALAEVLRVAPDPDQ